MMEDHNLGGRLMRRVRAALAMVLGMALTACGSGSGGGSSTTPSIQTQPSNASVIAGQTATFSVSADGMAPLSYQWQKGSDMISGATSASYTTPATVLGDSGSTFSVTVSNSLGSVTSNSAKLTVTETTASIDVVTWHNDNARTGQNISETVLTTSNVASASFGKINFFTMDGKVDAQPLYVSGAAVPGSGTHNLLLAASEHGTVYAFDADTGATIWSKSTLKSGETTSDTRGCSQVDPEIGVTSTPVIDRTRGANGVVYVVAMSKTGSSTYHQRIHALDLALGTELFGGPVDVQATYPGTGDNTNGTNVIFDPAQYKERAGLLLLNGVVYTAWGSHCDIRPYTGWIIGYDAGTLAQTSVLNVDPNGNGGAIWNSGAGMAADDSGYIYFLDANGSFDTSLNGSGFPANGDYGNAFMKLSTTGNHLAVADYFEMYNQSAENGADIDLGSGGAMLLPDLLDSGNNTRQLAVGAGKDGVLYVVDRTNMGKFKTGSNQIYQNLVNALPGGIWGAPAYFNDTVYFSPINSPIRAFKITNAKLATSATATTPNRFDYPGVPSVSANGTSNGIVWAVESSTTAVLHAYDATTLDELYNSNQAASSRDHFGAGNKFMTPLIVNGKVFVGTPTGVAVFGLLP